MINIIERLELNNKNTGRIKKNKEIFEKYKDKFDNISEFIYYYKNPLKAEKERHCKICGKRTKFIQNRKYYQQYCSLECSNSDPIRKERLKQYNAELKKNKNKKQEQINKIKATKLKRYNNPNFNNVEKRIATNLIKYGVKHVAQNETIKEKTAKHNLEKWGYKSTAQHPEIRKKQKDTLEKHFGVRETFKSKEIRQKVADTQLKKYGVTNYTQSKEYQNIVKQVQEKRYATMKEHNSFNYSEPEEQVYKELINKFGKQDIIRQYKSEKYPYKSDFYIKSLSLYIECHFNWTHGTEPFDEKSIEHQEKVAQLIEDSKKSKYYSKALYVWTVLDVAKLRCFKENKLSYKIFYNINQFYNWYNKI